MANLLAAARNLVKPHAIGDVQLGDLRVSHCGMQTLADRLGIVLKLRGWAAREWARKAELPSEASVGHVLSGETRGMRPESIVKLAKVAHVNVEWLLTGEGKMGGGAHDAHVQPSQMENYDLAIEVVRRSVDPVAFDEFRSTHSNRYPSDLAQVVGVIGLANMMRDDFERAQRGVVPVGRVMEIDMDAEAPIAAVWRAEAAAKGVAKKTKGK